MRFLWFFSAALPCPEFSRGNTHGFTENLDKIFGVSAEANALGHLADGKLWLSGQQRLRGLNTAGRHIAGKLLPSAFLEQTTHLGFIHKEKIGAQALQGKLRIGELLCHQRKYPGYNLTVPAVIVLFLRLNLQHPFQRAFQLRGLHRLQHIVCRTQPQRLPHVIKILITGEDNEFRLCFALQIRDHFQPVFTGHDHIRDHHVRLVGQDQPFSLAAVLRLSDQPKAQQGIIQQRFQLLPHQFFVIHDQQLFHRPAPPLQS